SDRDGEAHLKAAGFEDLKVRNRRAAEIGTQVGASAELQAGIADVQRGGSRRSSGDRGLGAQHQRRDVGTDEQTSVDLERSASRQASTNASSDDAHRRDAYARPERQRVGFIERNVIEV